MKFIFILNSILVMLFFKVESFAGANSDVNRLKCLVCQTIVEEIQNEVDKVNSNRRSEIFFTELMDTVCDKMDDYARATYKSNGELVIIPLIKDGKMNPILDKVNLVQDADLNKSLKHYCLQVLDEYDEDIQNLVQSGVGDVSVQLCTRIAKLCKDGFENWEDEL